MSFLLSCALVAGSMFLFGLAVDDFYLRLLFKPIPQACLLIWLFSQEKTSYRNILSLGLISCIIADILLEFRQLYFLQGVIIFLIGHIFLHLCIYKKRIKAKSSPSNPFCHLGSDYFYDNPIRLGKNVLPCASLHLSYLPDDVESSMSKQHGLHGASRCGYVCLWRHPHRY